MYLSIREFVIAIEEKIYKDLEHLDYEYSYKYTNEEDIENKITQLLDYAAYLKFFNQELNKKTNLTREYFEEIIIETEKKMKIYSWDLLHINSEFSKRNRKNREEVLKMIINFFEVILKENYEYKLEDKEELLSLAPEKVAFVFKHRYLDNYLKNDIQICMRAMEYDCSVAKYFTEEVLEKDYLYFIPMENDFYIGDLFEYIPKKLKENKDFMLRLIYLDTKKQCYDECNYDDIYNAVAYIPQILFEDIDFLIKVMNISPFDLFYLDNFKLRTNKKVVKAFIMSQSENKIWKNWRIIDECLKTLTDDEKINWENEIKKYNESLESD